MSPLRILWTLCLALLLPLGQAAAAAHELSHVQQRTDSPAKGGVVPAHCDICGVAAAVSGGAAPAAPPQLALLDVAHERASSHADTPASPLAPRFYPARAPPSLPH